MSKKKDNFNQAMYEMFGIGRDTSADVDEEPVELFTEEPEVAPIIENVPETPAPAPAATVPPRKTQTTYFAEGTSIEGTLRCDSDIELCGDFKGELFASGKVIMRSNTTSNVQAVDLVLIKCNLTGETNISNSITIDEDSTLVGGVTAKDVVCSGVVRGNMNVSGNLTLNAKSKVFGDIKTNSLVIERGARVTGKIEMSGQ